MERMLQMKNAVVYGAGGAVGGAVARAFAAAGARVFLTARSAEKLSRVVEDIVAAGGRAEVAEVDATDERAVEAHLAGVVATAGSVDVSFNAIGVPQEGIQGTALVELPLERFALPIDVYTRSHFLTARAAARRMLETRSGVILMHTPEPGRTGAPLVGGMGPAWAALEGLARDLSWELAPHGVRTVCIRTTGMPETATIDVVYGLHARALGITPGEFQAMMDERSANRRPTTLRELAGAAVFLASDAASGITGTVVNLTAGKAAD